MQNSPEVLILTMFKVGISMVILNNLISLISFPGFCHSSEKEPWGSEKEPWGSEKEPWGSYLEP